MFKLLLLNQNNPTAVLLILPEMRNKKNLISHKKKNGIIVLWQINSSYIYIILIICYIYIVLFWVLKALYTEGGISSSTTNVQHPPGWWDGSHIAPERPPHTSLLVERRQSDESNQCMGMIRRPWWSEASGEIWPEGHPGIFNDHRESGPRFNVSSEGRCFVQYSVPVTILGC